MSILYIIATPIGNLEDITLRALRILKEVDWIAAEDTRQSSKLCKHFGIETPMIALHEFNEKKFSEKLIEKLKAGQRIALISDAGTPLISDPGYQLIHLAHQSKIPIVPIPGPCAAITALCAAGLPTHEFFFAGFLPPKKQAREKKLNQFKEFPFTLIFYEAPHRILKTLEDLIRLLGGERLATIGRELTKIHESILHDTLDNLQRHFLNRPEELRGEFVILINGAKENTSTDSENFAEALKILKTLASELPLAQAIKLTAQLTGQSKNKLYEMALSIKRYS